MVQDLQRAWSMTPTIKDPPANYIGSFVDWKALSSKQRYKITHVVKVTAERKLYHDKNRHKIAIKKAVWVKNNKEKRRIYNKAFYEKQKYSGYYQDVYLPSRKVYRDQNREALNTKSRAYYHENSDTIMEKQRLSKIKKAKEFYALHGTWEIQPGIY